jgi:cob(I)alamin adenosyltransferase
MRKGLLIVFTGEGKGKTTAALGTALRAIGQGFKVMMIQFIKGSWKSSELESARKLAPMLEIRPMGRGFVFKDKGPTPEDIKAAEDGWALAKDKMHSGEYDVIILDELNNAVHYGLLKLDDVLQGLKARPETLHVIVTGRYAKPQLIEAADLVTEMVPVKHPYQEGIQAQAGIDF